MTKRLLTRHGWHIRASRRYAKTQAFKVMNPQARTSNSRKKRRGKALSRADKGHNRVLARVRVRGEHAVGGIKRARVLKDTLCNWQPPCSDRFIEIATGLHNLRLRLRKRRLRL